MPIRTYKSEIARFYRKVDRNTFAVLWEDEVGAATINQQRNDLFRNKRKRERFCQLAFTSVWYVEPLDSSKLAMGRFLFGVEYERYHPSIDEKGWREDVASAFADIKRRIGIEEADELLYRFEVEMQAPTSLTFLDSVIFEDESEAVLL